MVRSTVLGTAEQVSTEEERTLADPQFVEFPEMQGVEAVCEPEYDSESSSQSSIMSGFDDGLTPILSNFSTEPSSTFSDDLTEPEMISSSTTSQQSQATSSELRSQVEGLKNELSQTEEKVDWLESQIEQNRVEQENAGVWEGAVEKVVGGKEFRERLDSHNEIHQDFYTEKASGLETDIQMANELIEEADSLQAQGYSEEAQSKLEEAAGILNQDQERVIEREFLERSLAESDEIIAQGQQYVQDLQQAGDTTRKVAVGTTAVVITVGSGGTLTGVAIGIAGGTLAGSGYHVAKEGHEVSHGRKSVGEAAGDIVDGMIDDAVLSAKASLSAAAGLGAAKALSGPAQSALTRLFASGAAGATAGSIGAALGNAQELTTATLEFVEQNGAEALSTPEGQAAYVEHLASKGLTLEEIAIDIGIEGAVGSVGGGVGGAGSILSSKAKTLVTRAVAEVGQAIAAVGAELELEAARSGEPLSLEEKQAIIVQALASELAGSRVSSSRTSPDSNPSPAAIRNRSEVENSPRETPTETVDTQTQGVETSAQPSRATDPSLRRRRPKGKSIEPLRRPEYLPKDDPRVSIDESLDLKSVEVIEPSSVRTTQTTIKGRKLDDLVEDMRENGFDAKPRGGASADRGILDVVEMPDGGLSSVDNKRIVAAEEAGVPVVARVRGHNEPIADPEVRERLSVEVKNKETGERTVVEPQTWGEAIILRVQDQKPSSFGENKPYGSWAERPRGTGY